MNKLTPIGRSHQAPVSVPTAAGLVSPSRPAAASHRGDPENFIELGYGIGPRCIECRKNVSMCLCGSPEPEEEYFRPGGNWEVHVRCLGDGSWRAEG